MEPRVLRVSSTLSIKPIISGTLYRRSVMAVAIFQVAVARFRLAIDGKITRTAAEDPDTWNLQFLIGC